MQMVAAIEGMIELETERYVPWCPRRPMPDTSLRNTLLDELLSFDRAKHRKRQQMKTRTDTFLVKSQLCHDIYNRYVTPQVALACSEAAARCTCSDAPAPAANTANTSNAPTDTSSVGVTSDSTTAPQPQPTARASASSSPSENPAVSSPLPTTWPWRDPEDDRVNGLKPYVLPKTRKINEPLDVHEEFVNELVELVENVSISSPHSTTARSEAMGRWPSH